MSVRREGKLNNIGAKVENGVRRGLIEGGMLVAQRATRKAPRKTGRLKRSIGRGQPYASGPNRWAIDVGTNVEYARIREFGDPNELVIYPKTKKALAFNWPNAPYGLKYKGQLGTTSTGMMVAKEGIAKAQTKFVFAHVTRPPVKPTPYLRPALSESRGGVRRLLLSSVVGALRTI